MKKTFQQEVENAGFKVWDQAPGQHLPVEDIIKMYENGFAGSICSEEAEEELLSQVTFKYGSQVCDTFGYGESAAGKLVVPFTYIDKYYGVNQWHDPGQGVGNCFLAGTLVTMADGSKKPIEQVSVGDRVITHLGNAKTVVDLIERKEGDFVYEFKVKTYNKTLICTKDHELFSPTSLGDEKPTKIRADQLNIGQMLLIGKPIVEKQKIVFDLKDYGGTITDELDFKKSRTVPVEKGFCRAPYANNSSKRFIEFNENFAYILGAYLAEGHVSTLDKNGGTVHFSISSKESLFKNKICEISKELFGITPKVYLKNKNKSVCDIVISSLPLANLFRSLAGGHNAYTKSVPWQALCQSKLVRLNLIQGWIDGDGYYRQRGLTKELHASSASQKLAIGMYDLINSCGLKCSIRTKKAHGHSKEAYTVSLYSDSATLLQKQTFQPKLEIKTNPNKLGIPVKIQEINKIPYSGKVYCLTVEDDHSFIADGFSVSNCVSRGQTHANLTTLVCEVYFGQPDQITGLSEMLPKDSRRKAGTCPLACEPVYWFRGSGGHGWSCSASTQTSLNYTGVIPRINIDGLADFSQYDERVGTKYGARKPPQDVIDKINKNLFREATKIDSFESLRELLNRGFGVNSCGSQGFASKRDENGVARKSGSWAHSMAFIGCDDRTEIVKIYGEPLVLVLNSWGPNWISGPTKIYGTSINIPNGSFWAKWSDVKNRDSYAIAGLNGWARQELPNLEPDFI